MSNLIKEHILDVPDFPKKGIVFKDITPIFESPLVFTQVTNYFVEQIVKHNVSKVIGIDSRGFLFGAAAVSVAKVPLVLARKPGKLPRKTEKQTYSLEYGEDSLEIHIGAIDKSDNVLIIDDVLATGGTANAAVKLVKKLGAKSVRCAFLMELSFLNGSSILESEHSSLLEY